MEGPRRSGLGLWTESLMVLVVWISGGMRIYVLQGRPKV